MSRKQRDRCVLCGREWSNIRAHLKAIEDVFWPGLNEMEKAMLTLRPEHSGVTEHGHIYKVRAILKNGSICTNRHDCRMVREMNNA